MSDRESLRIEIIRMALAAGRRIGVQNRMVSLCDFCGAEIASADFEAGRAATLMKKNYCPRCMAAAIERSKREDFIPEFLTPQPGRVQSPLKPPSAKGPAL